MATRIVTVRGMSYPSDLTDEQWDLLEPVFNTPGKRGRKHADDLRGVVDAILYIAQGHRGCCPHPGPAPRLRGPQDRAGGQAAGVPPHPQGGVGCVRTATHQAR